MVMDRHRQFFAVILILTVLVTAQMEAAAQTSTNGPFQILSLQPTFNPLVSSNGYIITWNAATGLVNYVTYADSLGAPWQDLVGFYANSGPTIMVATDYPPVGTMQRFYQVKATPAGSIVMSLVLDRSGSMLANGGYAALLPAVTNFISLFNDRTDYAAMVSFSSAASVDVPMEQQFITNIEDAALSLSFGGDTCSEQGLTNALAQNNTVTAQPRQQLVKVIVFFTDGMANTFNYVFNCGLRNIGLPNGTTPMLFDPVTGNIAMSGCTIPSMLSSIDPVTGAITANAVDTTSCVAMHHEAENRAERIAWLARSQGNTIYCVGLGDPATPGECNGDFPVLNLTFLENVANTTDSATYDPSQPVGDIAIASDSGELTQIFQVIASKIIVPP